MVLAMPTVPCCALVLTAVGGLAAADLVVPAPVVVGNQHRYPTGHQSGLQGGAVLAQISGAESAWTNPAGLVVDGGLPASASANLYSFDLFRVSGAQDKYSNWEAQVIPSAISGSFAIPTLSAREWRAAVFLVQPQLWKNEVVFHRQEVLSGQFSEALSESDGAVETLCPGLALAHRLGERWRVGIEVHVAYFSYRVQSTNTNRSWTQGGNFQLGSVSQVARLGFYHLVTTLGVQGQLGGGWTMGATVRPPGLQVWQFGRLDSSVIAEGANYQYSSLAFDDGPHLHYRQPAEVTIGGSYASERWGVEADLRARPSAGSYRVAQATHYGLATLTQRATGITVLEPTTPLALDTAAAAGLGMSMGSWVRFKPTVIGHCGWWYDPSPVEGSGDDLFSPISLYGASLGLSYVRDDFSLSLGLLGSWGRARDVKVFSGSASPTGSTLEVLGLGATISTSMSL